MRICLVYDACYPFVRGGAERRNHELATRLSQAHDVHIVTWRYWDGPATITRDGVTFHGVGAPPPFYGADGKRTVREAVSFCLRVLPVLLRQRFDLIDCSANPFVPLFAVWLASRIRRTPLVVTWHEFWGEHWAEYLPKRPFISRVARFLEARAAALGDLRACVSPLTRSRLQLAGVPGDRLRLAPNGVSIDDFESLSSSRRQWDVVFVGRLIDEKRVDLLLDAVALATRTRPQLRCLIVGDGPERDRLQARATQARLGTTVRFEGNVADEEVRALLSSSKLLVLPSEREGFGMVAIEAQAAGCVPVVVLSQNSAAAGLIEHGVDGLTCESTAEALSEAMESLLGDPSRLARMRRAARGAARRWDWGRLTRTLEGIYSEVTGGVSDAERKRALSWP